MTLKQPTSEELVLTYPYKTSPASGTTMEVAPGIKWLRMPLPMSLDHINLYLIEDDDGWAVVDTGIRGEETRNVWKEIIANELEGKPITRIICTHMHPDHTGQSGFLYEHFEAPLYMSFSEYYQGKTMGAMMSEGGSWQMSEYFLKAGIEQSFLESMREARSTFAPEPDDLPLPGSFIRLTDGDELKLGENNWKVITGTGHSPEHVTLYCQELRILVSGDQILPVITSNVSVHPTEPFANPMVGWLESHEKFKAILPNDILVLPAHNMPFYGVQERLQQLIDHHEDRMLILEENCIEPQIAMDLLPFLFARKLEGYTVIMALGECIAHLHCLMTRNRIERIIDDGFYKYRSIAPDLAQRARPGHHEPRDESPGFV